MISLLCTGVEVPTFADTNVAISGVDAAFLLMMVLTAFVGTLVTVITLVALRFVITSFCNSCPVCLQFFSPHLFPLSPFITVSQVSSLIAIVHGEDGIL